MSYILKSTKVALADIEKHKKAGNNTVLKNLKKIPLMEPGKLS